MNEKRFQLDIGDDYCFINDKIEDKTYAIYNDRFKERWSQEIVALLNTQQATIQSLKEENEQLKGLIKKTLETTPIEHNLAVALKNSVREFYE